MEHVDKSDGTKSKESKSETLRLHPTFFKNPQINLVGYRKCWELINEVLAKCINHSEQSSKTIVLDKDNSENIKRLLKQNDDTVDQVMKKMMELLVEEYLLKK